MWKLVCAFFSIKAIVPFALFSPCERFLSPLLTTALSSPRCSLCACVLPARPTLTTQLPPPARQVQCAPSDSSLAPRGTCRSPGCTGVTGTLPGCGVPRHGATLGVRLGVGCVPPAGRGVWVPPWVLHMHAWLSNADCCVPSSRDASQTWRHREEAAARLLDLTWRLACATRHTISDEGWDGVRGRGAVGRLCRCPRRKGQSRASPTAMPAGDAPRCSASGLGRPCLQCFGHLKGGGNQMVMVCVKWMADFCCCAEFN